MMVPSFDLLEMIKFLGVGIILMESEVGVAGKFGGRLVRGRVWGFGTLGDWCRFRFLFLIFLSRFGGVRRGDLTAGFRFGISLGCGMRLCRRMFNNGSRG